MQDRTVIISCAGSGGANNLIRSIRASKYGDSVTTVGVDANKYLINKALSEHKYVVPYGSDEGYLDAINEIVARHDADLFIPQHETEILEVAKRRDELDCRTLLPKAETVELCLDKYRLNQRLDELGFQVPKTVSIGEMSISEAFEELAPGEQPLWCRTRFGSSSFEAQPMYSVEQARQWVTYWTERAGFSREEFTFSEFLPGRDFHILTLWNDGELLIGKGNERNQYFFGVNTGVATPLVGRQLYDEDLQRTCEEIARSLDVEATGNFGFDFRQDPDGVPKLTEINIGKFSMVNHFFNFSGDYNMAEIFLNVCFADETGVEDLEDPFGDNDTDLFLSRGIDLEPEIFSLDEIEGVEDLSDR
jgi:carbamoylphosphate synthase large subunit